MNDRSRPTSEQLRRLAVVYIRQSSPGQVLNNVESGERQYEFVERAVSLGWRREGVVVIDEDHCRRGSESEHRGGLQHLVAEVGLGHVGLVLGIEVSRLARRNADWYNLMDLCALTDTLIADGDGVYHPGDHNSRLVLGLKGTLAEAELHLIRQRLVAARLHKAAKGELRLLLPVGLDYGEDGQVVLARDESVRTALAEVFDRFTALSSARQVLLSLHADGLKLPRRGPGEVKVTSVEARYRAVHEILTKPAYAGAFVFGRTRQSKSVGEDGRVLVRSRQVAREEWEVCIPDHHPGYIEWETYLANQQRLAANRVLRGGAGGAPREGRALLQGLARCGRCGRKMQVGYWAGGATGQRPTYTCTLSDGRLTVGVGVGWSREEFAALGVPFARRGQRADEYLRAMRVLWRDDIASFDGEFVSFDAVRVNPKPVRDRKIPIVIGGNGEPALRRVAAVGDGWYGFNLAGVEEVHKRITTQRQLCRDQGAQPQRAGSGSRARWRQAGRHRCPRRDRRERTGVGRRAS